MIYGPFHRPRNSLTFRRNKQWLSDRQAVRTSTDSSIPRCPRGTVFQAAEVGNLFFVWLQTKNERFPSQDLRMEHLSSYSRIHPKSGSEGLSPSHQPRDDHGLSSNLIVHRRHEQDRARLEFEKTRKSRSASCISAR